MSTFVGVGSSSHNIFSRNIIKHYWKLQPKCFEYSGIHAYTHGFKETPARLKVFTWHVNDDLVYALIRAKSEAEAKNEAEKIIEDFFKKN